MPNEHLRGLFCGAAVIDKEGYRANVGIIIINEQSKVFWAKRLGQDAWQFPQGGIDQGETPEQAMYRELFEEVGLLAEDVEILSRTSDWLRYEIPEHLIRKNTAPRCVGQKQIWFLLRMKVDDSKVSLANVEQIEFDQWQWVDRLIPQDQVIEFKRDVYKQAMLEFTDYFS